MRALASIQEITELFPIDGADRIELAQIEGWKVIVRKGLYSVGDMVVYFEVDSLLPHTDERHDEFVEYTKGKCRVRTIKMRGVYSQGYCMPINQLTDKELHDSKAICQGTGYKFYKLGTDLTKVLKVEKYETDKSNLPSTSNGKAIAVNPYTLAFPSFIPKTDEQRIQKLPALIRRLQGTEVYVTEKLDGSSMTCYYVPDTKVDGGVRFGVCSRNLELLDELPEKSWFEKLVFWVNKKFFKGTHYEGTNQKDTDFWKMAYKMKLKPAELPKRVLDLLMAKYPKGFAIQGELVGPKCNSNKHKLKEHQYRIFSVYNVDTRQYEGWSDINDVSALLGLNTVPFLESFSIDKGVDELVEYAKGRSLVGDLAKREGVVIRTLDGKTSMKAINPDFLIWADKKADKEEAKNVTD
jgi:RNA ligase (TIGR02306 family)